MNRFLRRLQLARRLASAERHGHVIMAVHRDIAGSVQGYIAGLTIDRAAARETARRARTRPTVEWKVDPAEGWPRD